MLRRHTESKIAGTSIGQCLILEECCKRLVQTPLQIHSFLLNGLIQLGKGRLQRRDGFLFSLYRLMSRMPILALRALRSASSLDNCSFFLFFWNVPKFFLYGLYFLRGNGSILPGLLDNLAILPRLVHLRDHLGYEFFGGAVCVLHGFIELGKVGFVQFSQALAGQGYARGKGFPRLNTSAAGAGGTQMTKGCPAGQVAGDMRFIRSLPVKGRLVTAACFQMTHFLCQGAPCDLFHHAFCLVGIIRITNLCKGSNLHRGQNSHMTLRADMHQIDIRERVMDR